MSLAQLLTQTADIEKFVLGGEDDRGNRTEGEWSVDQKDVAARGELMFSEEDANERNTNFARWRVFLEPSVTVNVNNRLVLHLTDGDLPLEILGIDPEQGRTALHHYVVWCQTTANTGWNNPD